MKDRNYLRFMSDVRRYRPLIVIALAAIVMVPNLLQVASQEMTTSIFLTRFAESLAVIGALVWAGSSLVLRYALQQARAQLRERRESGIDA